MALHLLTSDQVHSSCRQRIEACELWLRRVIHETFRTAFGQDYIEGAELNGQPIFSNKVKARVRSFLEASPGQYARPIDTLLFDDLGAILSKEDVYRQYFKPVFENGFPMGVQHLRQLVSAIVPIRNALSHANGATISLHDAERALCYCNDIISLIKDYYSTMSAADKFPAPVFTRYSDSLGTVWHPTSPTDQYVIQGMSLYVGDEVRFEVEVDSTFPPEEYEIKWAVCNISQGESGSGSFFNLKITPRHVGQRFALQVTLKSNKDWHRLQNMDAYLTTEYEVLPVPR